MCDTHGSFGCTNIELMVHVTLLYISSGTLLPKSEESAVAGYHYAPTVLFVPNCTLSPCGEQIHEQKTQRIVLVCVLCGRMLLFL